MNPYFISLHTIIYWHGYFRTMDDERAFLDALANEENQ